jgi:gliding motility-associated lipoprotein GldH
MRYLKVISSVLLVVLLASCEEKPYFSKKIDLGGNWNYSEELIFPMEIEQLDQTFDLILSLTYGIDFAYQNIYVKIVTQYPNGKEDEDILSLNLTNGSGLFLGDCSSSKCEIDLLLQEKFKFNEKGKYVITIIQNGREENINEVYSAALKLYYHKN